MAGRGVAKGKRGERDVIAMLTVVQQTRYQAAGWTFAEKEGRRIARPPARVVAPDNALGEIRRNLEQSRGGGADVIGLPGFSIEIKNHSQLNLTAWWRQTLRQAQPGELPVLIYKAGRGVWRVKTLGSVGCIDACTVDIEFDTFLKFFADVMDKRLAAFAITKKRRTKT